MPPIEQTSGEAPAGHFRPGLIFYAGASRTNGMNRNIVVMVIGVLAIAVAVLGYQVYQERHKSGVEISIGNSGISIEKK